MIASRGRVAPGGLTPPQFVLGGPSGRRFEVAPTTSSSCQPERGICNAGLSDDLPVVGPYPNGVSWDLRRGDLAKRHEDLANIATVRLPGTDAVYGQDGPGDRDRAQVLEVHSTLSRNVRAAPWS
jgi:uncharacterized protein YjlB